MEEEDGGEYHLGQWALGLFLVLALLPLVPNKKVRYFGVYISYVLVVSTIGCILIPLFALRPRNIGNLKIAAYLMRNLTKILGIEWELRNGDVIKKDRAAVICANHQTILDIMGMFNIWDVMDKCTAVAKREILYVIPFGPAAWMAGLVFIDRNTPKLANAQLNEASNILHRLKVKFWMFPEGTRNKTGDKLLPFKKGAFRIAIESQVPIIPVVYSPYYFIDKKNTSFDEGKVIISALEPIPTEGLTLDDIDKLMENTYAVMSEEYERLKNETSVYRDKKLCKS